MMRADIYSYVFEIISDNNRRNKFGWYYWNNNKGISIFQFADSILSS